MDVDYTLETLLDLDGVVIYQEVGYWIFIEAKSININERVPHGIKYSLTLHDSTGNRVLGMDNAHPIAKATTFGKKPRFSDHIHTANGRVIPYEFINAGKLLQDFFDLADSYMKEKH